MSRRLLGLVCLVLRNIPDELAGIRVRRYFYKRLFASAEGSFIVEADVLITGFGMIKIKGDVQIARGAHLYAHDHSRGLSIGHRASIGPGSIISATNGGAIEIGEAALLGPRVTVMASDHKFHDKSSTVRGQGHTGYDLRIGRDAWIGANSVILGGATIGDGSVVGAGAVVTTDIPPMQVWGGVPARFIKNR